MKVAVLGGGFGLYGYLPALATRPEISILLADRYRDRLAARAELSGLGGRVSWVPDEEHQLAAADAVVIALRPNDQVALARRALAFDNIERILLEKPVAANPRAALELLRLAEASGKVMRTGHNFHLTDWAVALTQEVAKAGSDCSIEVNWRFKAHHYAAELDTWKRRIDEGGGALRFFGIHLIALAAALGFDDVIESRSPLTRGGEAETWQAVLRAAGGARLSIQIDSSAETPVFDVSAVTERGSRVLAALRDPFEHNPGLAGYDRRTEILTRLVEEFLTSPTRILDRDRRTIALWQRVEDTTASDVRS
jgi:predicted dehydrogenase